MKTLRIPALVDGRRGFTQPRYVSAVFFTGQ